MIVPHKEINCSRSNPDGSAMAVPSRKWRRKGRGEEVARKRGNGTVL
jgi:hypothetical protein